MKAVSNRALSEMSADYDEVAKALGKMAKHVSADASDVVSEASRTFAHAASDLADKIKAQSKLVAKRSGEEVREHPIAAAAIAAAAVGLVGYAIARTRNAHREHPDSSPGWMRNVVTSADATGSVGLTSHA